MYDLTTQQQNIWNLQSYYEDTSISNISGILHFKERLDTDVLEKAINLQICFVNQLYKIFSKNALETLPECLIYFSGLNLFGS